MAKEYKKLPPLEVSPAIADALDNYSKTTGVPKAKIRREILYNFFAPLMAMPDLTQRLEAADAARLAARAADLGAGSGAEAD
ncbi:MAG: hypothetical protein KGL39_12845 [Patescibacteria group bacterium]|nr:hypothetical protein [Patescibacteria group bacterium]